MITIVMAATFLVGALTGALAVLRLDIRCEESEGSLRQGIRARSAGATRRVVGLYARTAASGTRPTHASTPISSREDQDQPNPEVSDQRPRLTSYVPPEIEGPHRNKQPGSG